MVFSFFKNFFRKKNKNNSLGTFNTENNLYQWIEKVNSQQKINLNLLDELEILLIKSDMGIKTSAYIKQEIKKTLKEKKIEQSSCLVPLVKETMLKLYQSSSEISMNSCNIQTPHIYLLVGVNGVGKTTTIGKLAHKFKAEGKKVLLVAGDLFRTGATEQLQMWGYKTNNQVFTANNNNKTSVANLFFDALNYAQKNQFDIVLGDVSGRLANKINLIKELEKIKKIIHKTIPQACTTFWLVLDAMTGQNAFQQIDVFHQAVTLEGIILTKFDGISKGDIILAIKHLYKLPTRYIGIGEKSDDLITFDIQDYLDNYFAN